MRVPLSWLREFVELPQDPQHVAELLAGIGFPVESIEHRPTITGVVVGRIAELRKHPNADRLQVGSIDVGNGTPLTIATAATNVAQGQTIAVARIGARLPALTIERRKMRGLESEGMMISAEELALPAEWFEDGIMQLEPQSPLGADVVEHFGLAEAVLDIEITSNRADAMSVLGLARELAAATGALLRMPVLTLPAKSGPGSADDPVVRLESPDCSFFLAQRFTGLTVGISPAWMRIRLALAGQRPINSLVDISNYVMLETGQPLHFYDASAVQGALTVRDAADEEHLQALDGVDHRLSASVLVVADERGALGLAGIKGGASSEVTAQTQSIVLESATFNGARIRRGAATLGLRTEASTRHEKALSPYLARMGAARAAELLAAGGAHVHAAQLFGTAEPTREPIEFDPANIRRLLGFSPSPEEVREALDRLGFTVEDAPEEKMRVLAPPWRTDISGWADIVEEIARMAGYDRVEGSVPAVPSHNISSHEYVTESSIAHTLRELRYREIVSYSLHGASLFETLARGGIEPHARPVEVRNPLSEEQRYLRYALGPAILAYFARVDEPIRIFEIGHVFYQEDRQPLESAAAAFGFTAMLEDESPWRDDNVLRLRADCEALLERMTGRRDFEIAADRRNGMHPGKTAAILLDGREIASLGRVSPRVQKAYGLRFPAYLCNLYLDKIPEYRTPHYDPPPRFPSTYRDLALLCDASLPAQSLERAIVAGIGPLCIGARTFDEYRDEHIGVGHKSLAVRVTMRNPERTITDEEADAAVAAALAALERDLGATLRR